MKRMLLPLCTVVMLFTACKEKQPPLTYSSVMDTTYLVATIPATVPHHVLIEEFTGQSCSNCPDAHDKIDAIVASHPNAVNVIGMYLVGPLPCDQPNGSKNDLRDATATDIGAAIFASPNIFPEGSVDRLPVDGNTLLDRGLWGSIAASLMDSVTDPLNLDVTSSFNTLSGQATIVATVTYTRPVASAQNISIVVVEDSIIDCQDFPVFPAIYPNAIDTAYVFTNVFRGMVSAPPSGDLINTPAIAKEAGRVYRRTYTYTPKTLPAPNKPINPAHCKVIAFVTNTAGDKRVVQSAQAPLAP